MIEEHKHSRLTRFLSKFTINSNNNNSKRKSSLPNLKHSSNNNNSNNNSQQQHQQPLLPLPLPSINDDDADTNASIRPLTPSSKAISSHHQHHSPTQSNHLQQSTISNNSTDDSKSTFSLASTKPTTVISLENGPANRIAQPHPISPINHQHSPTISTTNMAQPAHNNARNNPIRAAISTHRRVQSASSSLIINNNNHTPALTINASPPSQAQAQHLNSIVNVPRHSLPHPSQNLIRRHLQIIFVLDEDASVRALAPSRRESIESLSSRWSNVKSTRTGGSIRTTGTGFFTGIGPGSSTQHNNNNNNNSLNNNENPNGDSAVLEDHDDQSAEIGSVPNSPVDYLAPTILAPPIIDVDPNHELSSSTPAPASTATTTTATIKPEESLQDLNNIEDHTPPLPFTHTLQLSLSGYDLNLDTNPTPPLPITHTLQLFSSGFFHFLTLCGSSSAMVICLQYLKIVFATLCCLQVTFGFQGVLPAPIDVANRMEEGTKAMARSKHEHIEVEGQSVRGFLLPRMQMRRSLDHPSYPVNLSGLEKFQELCDIQELLLANINHRVIQSEANKSRPTIFKEIHSPENMVDSLSDLLHEIGPIEIKKTKDYQNRNKHISISLQSLILKTMDYMYNHGLIKEEVFQHFLAKKGTLEIVALNLFFGPLSKTKDYFYHPSSYTFFGGGHFKYSRSIFEVLNMENKEFDFKDWKFDAESVYISDEFGNLMNSIFKDNHFFNSLEQYLSVSGEEKDTFEKSSQFLEVKNNIKRLSNLFMIIGDNSDIKGKEFHHRFLFILLDFIRDNYGGDLLENNSTNECMDRFVLMFSRAQFLEKSDRIQQYFQGINPQELSHFLNEENLSILEEIKNFMDETDAVLVENQKISSGLLHTEKLENYCMLEKIRKESDTFRERLGFLIVKIGMRRVVSRT
ncbi:hypothetical protein KEM48_010851 [Puccinia striiformis f. sp. tritici PST-130]|nr:hypothetical protein KEM48_010851 [Puccinia striiformis f. sp. tritici PST-130]